jgi:uncharacterized protein (DUF4415 family)
MHPVGKAYGARSARPALTLGGEAGPDQQQEPAMAFPNRPGATLTKTRRLALDRLGKRSAELRETPAWVYDLKAEVPAAWATLAQDIDVEEPRDKITLRLDRSVAQFYRAMGPGYQARMNRVLATYAQMKIAQVMEIDLQIGGLLDTIRAGLSVEEYLAKGRGR